MKRVQYDEKAFPVALLIMDMDNLKEVNDTLGHAKGDEYLETCGYLLDKCVRKQDVLARIGGDEFAVILKSSGKDTAERLARRIKRTFDEENERKAYKIPLSISIGYAVAESPEQDLEEIFDLADVAMYRQKASKSASGHR
jgi:diguanylate cyclase (GGDEF)-like protein